MLCWMQRNTTLFGVKSFIPQPLLSFHCKVSQWPHVVQQMRGKTKASDAIHHVNSQYLLQLMKWGLFSLGAVCSSLRFAWSSQILPFFPVCWVCPFWLHLFTIQFSVVVGVTKLWNAPWYFLLKFPYGSIAQGVHLPSRKGDLDWELYN